MRTLLLPLLVALLAMPVTAMAQDPVIRITGQGSVTAAPDRAQARIGVETENDSAAEAMAQNGKAMAAVLSALRDAGVAEADIRTSGIDLSSQRRRLPDGRVSEEETFLAQNTVTVTIRALDRLGAVIDAAVRAGANRLGGIGFSVADDAALLAEARRLAVEDARTAAETYAAAAGLALGPVREIIAADPAQGPVQRGFAMESAAVPVAPGTLSVGARVTVEWALSEAE